MKNNLVLIGMPSSGKSTLGVLLAKALGMDFIDTDILIQNETNRKLQDIITNDGIDKFLEIEDEILNDINVTNTVISTGGSAIFGDRSMNHLKETSKVIYIKLPYEEIERRIEDINTRGIAMSKDETLLDVYNKRIPLYEKYADIFLETLNLSIESSVEKLIKLLK